MAGLLGEIYSQGDRLKRKLTGLLADPVGSIQQTAGLLSDYRNEDSALQAQAFSDPQNPFRVTDPRAVGLLAERTLAGPLSMAPVGMLGANMAQQIAELMPHISAVPKGQRVGIRMMPSDVPTPDIGAPLRPSMKWVDGVQTEKPLYGTSAMDVSGRTEAEVEMALKRLGVFGNTNGYYPGNKLAVIAGSSKRKGEDAGEAMIKDALVRYLTDPPLGPR